MHWPYAKYAGCGNDFILFDNRSLLFPLTLLLIKKLCHRQNGIGADGLILLENSAHADFRFKIFNSDGSEAEMCGNGLRCFVKWLIKKGLNKKCFLIEVMHATLKTDIHEETICIEMKSPEITKWDIPYQIDQQELIIHFIQLGVPHAVIFCEEIEKINLLKWGSLIRNDSLWGPKGTNVTFSQITGSQKIQIRTFERGVEGETLACGTGAVAAALAATKKFGLLSPMTVIPPSNAPLHVKFSFHDEQFQNIFLEGPAEHQFSGLIELS